MTAQSCLVFSAIAPHPPIMVPEVGRESIVQVADSIDAMAELTRRVIESGAESVILISPHAPLEAIHLSLTKGLKSMVILVTLVRRELVSPSVSITNCSPRSKKPQR